MTGRELLPLIRSKGKDDKYSENLAKWVSKHKDWPMIVAFLGFCGITGETLEYDPAKSLPRQILIGIGDMDDGWIHGRRLSEITGGIRGVFSGEKYAYSHQFKPLHLPDWWQKYIEGGKCFIDPEHYLYGGKRWQMSDDGKTRDCVWCGNHRQEKHIEMVPKEHWRTKI